MSISLQARCIVTIEISLQRRFGQVMWQDRELSSDTQSRMLSVFAFTLTQSAIQLQR